MVQDIKLNKCNPSHEKLTDTIHIIIQLGAENVSGNILDDKSLGESKIEETYVKIASPQPLERKAKHIH